MKNNHLITDLGPHLLTDYSTPRPLHPKLYRLAGLVFATAAVAILCWLAMGNAHAQSASSDPMVMKIYPDGTKVVLRWSEVGKSVDNGEKFGGAPRIVAYDPAKDGIVAIGEPSQKQEAASSASSSVVSTENPAKMDYTNADPETFDDFGGREGFVFRTAVGAAFQQALSGRSGNGLIYNKMVFQPGIRYDLEAQYNVTDWFRTGVETAFVYNQIHSSTLDNDTAYNQGSNIGNGGLFQVPILYNANFRFPSDGPLQGYIGGGVGANWNVLQISSTGNNPYTSYHWNWAWQVTAGFTYCVTPGLDLDLGYKLLASANPNFADLGQFKTSYNHAAEIGLSWRF